MCPVGPGYRVRVVFSNCHVLPGLASNLSGRRPKKVENRDSKRYFYS